MFCTLNSWKRGLAPTFLRIAANLRPPWRQSSSDLAPVTTILPVEKTSAVQRGSRMRITTAANLRGLYSALRACIAIVFKSRSHARLHVATMF